MEQSLEKVGMDREAERDPQPGNAFSASPSHARLSPCHVCAQRVRSLMLAETENQSPKKTTSGQLFLTVSQ
jgi:hypothetical protein